MAVQLELRDAPLSLDEMAREVRTDAANRSSGRQPAKGGFSAEDEVDVVEAERAVLEQIVHIEALKRRGCDTALAEEALNYLQDELQDLRGHGP
jgi:hypothetical protein